jgi:hypothetical protein
LWLLLTRIRYNRSVPQEVRKIDVNAVNAQNGVGVAPADGLRYQALKINPNSTSNKYLLDAYKQVYPGSKINPNEAIKVASQKFSSGEWDSGMFNGVSSENRIVDDNGI